MLQYALDTGLANQVQDREWRAIGEVFRIFGPGARKLVVGMEGGQLVDAGVFLAFEQPFRQVEKLIEIRELPKIVGRDQQRGLQLFRRHRVQ